MSVVEMLWYLDGKVELVFSGMIFVLWLGIFFWDFLILIRKVGLVIFLFVFFVIFIILWCCLINVLRVFIGLIGEIKNFEEGFGLGCKLILVLVVLILFVFIGVSGWLLNFSRGN